MHDLGRLTRDEDRPRAACGEPADRPLDAGAVVRLLRRQITP